MDTNTADWSQWQTHRLDWNSARSKFWNPNGANVISNNVPKLASGFSINMWSDQVGWGGTMQPGQSGTLRIQKIDAYYNLTSASSGRRDVRHRYERRQSVGCKNVCEIDPAGTSNAAKQQSPSSGTSIDTCGSNGGLKCVAGMCCSSHG